MIRHAVCFGLAILFVFLSLSCSDTADESSQPDGDQDFEEESQELDLETDGDAETEADLPLPELPDVDELPDNLDLPDPLTMFNGEAVTTAEQWENSRRPEILRLYQHYAFGYTPQGAVEEEYERILSEPDFLEGRATLEILQIHAGPSGGVDIQLLLVIPNGLIEPPPLFLGLNFFGNHTVHPDPMIPLSDKWIPERGDGVIDNHATEASRGTSADRWPLQLIVESGYALATLYHGDIDPDINDFSNGIHPLYHDAEIPERGEQEWGAIGAWAWGLSRAVDVLSEHPGLDPARIIVMGHSRNGKAALWAAAQDQRITMAISNMSGCMGAAISRRKVGETLYFMNRLYPHWFAPVLHRFNENEQKLPFDQHHLIALMAPRPVLIASGEDDNWADPEGEFLGGKEAEPVYQLLGAGGMDADALPPVNSLISSKIGYHIRPGGHGVGEEDWRVFIRYANQWIR